MVASTNAVNLIPLSDRRTSVSPMRARRYAVRGHPAGLDDARGPRPDGSGRLAAVGGPPRAGRPSRTPAHTSPRPECGGECSTPSTADQAEFPARSHRESQPGAGARSDLGSTGVCRPAAAHAVAYAESAQPGAFRCAVRFSGHDDTTKRGTRTRGARPIGPRPSRTRHHDEMTGSPYSDLTRPPLREHDLRQALVTPGGVWTDVRVLTVTESTNADVASAAQAGAPDGLVVIAENQTAGRGRLGRRWEAPPRSALTFSVLLRPGVPAARLGWITLLAGVAVAESVGRVAVVDAVLKWPNDLLVRSALAGGAEQVEH